MPAPGDQHSNYSTAATTNPFEEAKPRISEYTAQEIATLQSRLEKQLGPEYISSRPGPGGQKVHYITGEKCIQLANEVFGFNGWSSSIMQIQVDYVDEDPVSRKVSLGLSVIVRVTLKDGTYHEDIGYGEMDNCKGKGAAFHKAKKEATTDALKRALRNFGNVLGNCIYDKAYLTKVMKVKVTAPKWDVDALHRHSDHVQVKNEPIVPSAENKKQKDCFDVKKTISDDSSTETLNSDLVAVGFLEDDFDDFDEADFGDNSDSDARPDEVVLPVSVPIHQSKAYVSAHSSTGVGAVKAISGLNGHSSENGATESNPRKGGPTANQQQSNIIDASSGLAKAGSGPSGGAQMRAPQETITTPRSKQQGPPGHIRVLNQPSRTAQAPMPDHIAQHLKAASNRADESADSLGVSVMVEGGFFSARAVTMLPELRDNDGPPLLPGNLPVFNPHAESPSIRKTPGINHNQTMPLTKELKHVPGLTQAVVATSNSARINVVNPQLDATRRIGVPGSPSPMANRNMYKPPTMKRPYQGQGPIRPPLGDLPPNEPIHVAETGGDLKRVRPNGS